MSGLNMATSSSDVLGRKIPKTKSLRQVRFLLSKSSPLTPAQHLNLVQELHSGRVKIKRSKSRKKK